MSRHVPTSTFLTLASCEINKVCEKHFWARLYMCDGYKVFEPMNYEVCQLISYLLSFTGRVLFIRTSIDYRALCLIEC